MKAEAASSGVRQPPHSQAKEDRTPEQSKSSKVTPKTKPKCTQSKTTTRHAQAAQAATCEMAGEESNEVVNYKQGLVAGKYAFLIWITFCLGMFAFSGQGCKHLISERTSHVAAMTGESAALSTDHPDKGLLGPNGTEGIWCSNLPRQGAGSLEGWAAQPWGPVCSRRWLCEWEKEPAARAPLVWECPASIKRLTLPLWGRLLKRGL